MSAFVMGAEPLNGTIVGLIPSSELSKRAKVNVMEPTPAWPALHRRIGGLIGHVHAVAVDVEFPTMVDAAQPALLVAAEEHRRPPVRAIGIDQANAVVAVAEGDQILAEESHPRGRAGVPASTRTSRSLSSGFSMPSPRSRPECFEVIMTRARHFVKFSA